MSQNSTPRTFSNRSKVWLYFKQCDDPNKARCSLCSIELCNRGTTTILWNHVNFKHSIDKNTKSNEQDQKQPHQRASELIMTPAKLKNENHTSKNLRQNLDFNDYDLSVTSMKPSSSTSLSKNLISRLNQLSSPVTRKLKFWNKKSFQVNQYDPSFKVIYLGNLGMQLWSKDESCLDKPLSTLWNNYLVNMKTEIVMRLTICNSGLKAITRQHGLTQYWSNRLVYCCSHKNYPRIFSWVYRHEGKKMRQELRCHAVLCPAPEKATKMVTMLNQRLACALQEFRREKKSRGLVSDISSTQQKLQPRTIPLRRQILAKGSANFRPPLERSKSAPKLTSILEEDCDSDDEASHDEFEFEESFDIREDSEYDGEEEDEEEVEEDIELERDGEEDSSTHKIESNSMTTTVNEETSNNSSVCATGDSSIDKNQGSQVQYQGHDIHNGTPFVNNHHQQIRFGSIAPNEVGDISANSQSDNQMNSHRQQQYHSTTKEVSQYSNDKINSHKNQDFLRSSANTNTSSSFQEQMVANQDTKHNNRPLIIDQQTGAKNNNTSNKKEPQPADQAEEQTQEIILSWSNLVIK